MVDECVYTRKEKQRRLIYICLVLLVNTYVKLNSRDHGETEVTVLYIYFAILPTLLFICLLFYPIMLLTKIGICEDMHVKETFAIIRCSLLPRPSPSY